MVRPNRQRVVALFILLGTVLPPVLGWYWMRSIRLQGQQRQAERLHPDLVETRVFYELAPELDGEIRGTMSMWGNEYVVSMMILRDPDDVRIDCGFTGVATTVETPNSKVLTELLDLTLHDGTTDQRTAIITLYHNREHRPDHARLMVQVPLRARHADHAYLMFSRDWPVAHLDLATPDARRALDSLLELAARISPQAEALLRQWENRPLADLPLPAESWAIGSDPAGQGAGTAQTHDVVPARSGPATAEQRLSAAPPSDNSRDESE